MKNCVEHLLTCTQNVILFAMFPVYFQIGMYQQETVHFGQSILECKLVGLYTEIGTHNMITEMVPVPCTG